MLKLASWNVNSLKMRLEQVLQWFQENQVDVLALQETKISDDYFPKQVFVDQGLHIAYSGQKTYNGVAIISRFPLLDVMKEIPGLEDPQRRILVSTVAGIRLINLYVPNGSEVGSEKYEYKLRWLAKVTTFLRQQLSLYPNLAVLGDFNIATEDIDVHEPMEWEGSVLVSPEERQAFSALVSLGLKDSFREKNRDTQLFSWWDYRAVAFRRNRGLRIDHILLSDALYESCKESAIDKEPRKAERPSDHTPVWVTLDVDTQFF